THSVSNVGHQLRVGAGAARRGRAFAARGAGFGSASGAGGVNFVCSSRAARADSSVIFEIDMRASQRTERFAVLRGQAGTIGGERAEATRYCPRPIHKELCIVPAIMATAPWQRALYAVRHRGVWMQSMAGRCDMIEKGAASMRRKEPMSATPLRTLSSALGVCAALALALFAGRADALDPSRTLTQCLLRKWQVQQGLPQATIFAIRQTADGYLWLGTQTGLFRFDGVRFSGVRGSKEARNENLWVQALCEDAEHDLWIATDGAGLLRLADS